MICKNAMPEKKASSGSGEKQTEWKEEEEERGTAATICRKKWAKKTSTHPTN